MRSWPEERGAHHRELIPVYKADGNAEIKHSSHKTWEFGCIWGKIVRRKWRKALLRGMEGLQSPFPCTQQLRVDEEPRQEAMLLAGWRNRGSCEIFGQNVYGQHQAEPPVAIYYTLHLGGLWES